MTLVITAKKKNNLISTDLSFVISNKGNRQTFINKIAIFFPATKKVSFWKQDANLKVINVLKNLSGGFLIMFPEKSESGQMHYQFPIGKISEKEIVHLQLTIEHAHGTSEFNYDIDPMYLWKINHTWFFGESKIIKKFIENP